MKNKFYWVPRVFGVLYLALVSAFFTIKFDYITNFSLLFGIIFAYCVLLGIAWKHELIGGILFLVIGVTVAFLPAGEGMAPTIILGVLFVIQSRLNKANPSLPA